MNISSTFPNENIAARVVKSMMSEKVLSSIRLTTGDQYFVFSVKTTHSEYVIRMTDTDHKEKFESAIYWQKKLMPLGIPLAKFIKSDLDGAYSQFPALLMMRLPGEDLCNLYLNLTDSDKRNLAKEMVKIQNFTNSLPEGQGYGIATSYEEILTYQSWYNFLIDRLRSLINIIRQKKIFDDIEVEQIISVTNTMEEELQSIPAGPFLWDASERNVLVYNGKISGIVDVDDICFGDPLFVLALTYVGLENEGYDTLYPQYWAEMLGLDKKAQLRLEFYRLFFSVVFMRKHGMITTNNKEVIYDVQRLKNIFQQSLIRIKKLEYENRFRKMAVNIS